MKRIVLSILIGCILFPLSNVKALSTAKLNYEIGAGYIFNTPFNNLLNNWGNGWSVGYGISYDLNSTLRILANISYQNYGFTGDNVSIALPCIAGLKYDITGENSQIYELSMGLRLMNSEPSTSTFFTIRGGISLIDIGEIIISTWMVDEPEKIHRSKYSDSGKYIVTGFASFGFGGMLPIKHNLNLILESRFTTTNYRLYSFVPISLAFQFKLSS